MCQPSFHICQYVLLFHVLQLPVSAGAEEYLSVDLSGSLNLILTAPHGGKIDSIATVDRESGCFINNSCVFEHGCGTQDDTKCDVNVIADYQTDVLTHLLREEIFALKGEYPKTIVSNIHRSKLDLNREINEATLGDEMATSLYNWYHSNISAAVAMLNGRPGLLLDIHGHGATQNWTMLGYLISKSELNNLDAAAMDLLASKSSIERLALAKASQEFNNLLRGDTSFGAAMQAESLEAVPSPQSKGPGSATYFSGGYTTVTYKNTVDVIQVEIARMHRTPKTNREAFASAFSKVIVDFYNTYYETATTTTTSKVTTTTSTGADTTWSALATWTSIGNTALLIISFSFIHLVKELV